MPAVRVLDIAEALIKSQGKQLSINFTGVRPGEKLHEILVSEEERHRTTQRNGYYVICPVVPELREGEVGKPPITSEYSSENITLDEMSVSDLYDYIKSSLSDMNIDGAWQAALRIIIKNE